MSYGELSEVSRIGEAELSVDWRIPNFPSLNCTRGNYYYSANFNFCDEKWWLKVFPNRNEIRNPAEGWVGLLLFRQGPKPKTFHITTGVRGSRGVENEREAEREFSCCSDVIYHWDEFYLRSKLMKRKSRLMPDDALTIACVIKVPGATAEVDVLKRSDQNVPKSRLDSKDLKEQEVDILKKSDQNVLKSKDSEDLKEQGVEELQISLKNMLRSAEDSDVTIKVQGKEFRAHRSILRARSPVFQAMFAHDMVEKQSGVVTMEDCDQETFSPFLEHVYTGSVEMVCSGNACNLYRASEKYDLRTLKKACAEFLKKNLTVASFCDAITLAVEYDDKELIERATEFFCKNAIHIVKTAEWQVFLAENPTVGNELYIKQLTK